MRLSPRFVGSLVISDCALNAAQVQCADAGHAGRWLGHGNLG